jgi:hypothetical protein
MNQRFKSLTIWSRFLIVILGFYASNGFCASAVDDFRKAADQGDLNAQFLLGMNYLLGSPQLKKNEAEGIRLIRKAAEQGYPKAQCYLGIWYSEGRYVLKNPPESAKWHLKAAEQGYALAQFKLGEAYRFGDGVPKDEIEALAWFFIATASGDGTLLPHDSYRGIQLEFERQLGRQASLLSQQRSKEIIKEIETAKQKRAKTEEPGQKPHQLADGNSELKGSGTGVIVSSNGLILTAAHVVGQSTDVKVATQKGLKAARVVKLDNVWRAEES